MVEQLPFYQKSFTVADTGKPTTLNPIILSDCDFQVQTNPCYFGDRNGQLGELSVGDTLSYRSSKGIDLRSIYFKNRNAGSNAVIIISGVF